MLSTTGLENQLMEVMARLDAVEKDLHTEKVEHKNDVDCLNAKIDSLTQENQLLKDDNARLRSIINNDSSNTSLPPSTDQKGTNISERDLRKAKNRQKMAGGFRKDSGHEMYCSILTIIETLKKRKMGMIENIKRLFQGTPAIF